MKRRPSPKQIAAAQVNGAKSPGPRDTSKTRYNAFDHGLYATLSIAQGSHLPEYPQYLELLHTLIARLGPAGHLPENVIICNELATALWRKARLFGYELAVLSAPDALNAPQLRNAARYLAQRDREFARVFDRYCSLCPAAPFTSDEPTAPPGAPALSDLPISTASPLDSAPTSAEPPDENLNRNSVDIRGRRHRPTQVGRFAPKVQVRERNTPTTAGGGGDQSKAAPNSSTGGGLDGQRPGGEQAGGTAPQYGPAKGTPQDCAYVADEDRAGINVADSSECRCLNDEEHASGAEAK